MEIILYFQQENKTPYLQALQQVDWSAARFLVSLLEEDRFFTMLGGQGELLLLMDGEELVSFCTMTGQDSVRDESLVPWIGFVHTAPQHRGHRYAGLVLERAQQLAKAQGYDKIYIATDEVGLYEKYGFQYLEDRIDYWGSLQQVLSKNL